MSVWNINCINRSSCVCVSAYFIPQLMMPEVLAVVQWTINILHVTHTLMNSQSYMWYVVLYSMCAMLYVCVLCVCVVCMSFFFTCIVEALCVYMFMVQ